MPTGVVVDVVRGFSSLGSGVGCAAGACPVVTFVAGVGGTPAGTVGAGLAAPMIAVDGPSSGVAGGVTIGAGIDAGDGVATDALAIGGMGTLAGTSAIAGNAVAFGFGSGSGLGDAVEPPLMVAGSGVGGFVLLASGAGSTVVLVGVACCAAAGKGGAAASLGSLGLGAAGMLVAADGATEAVPGWVVSVSSLQPTSAAIATDIATVRPCLRSRGKIGLVRSAIDGAFLLAVI